MTVRPGLVAGLRGPLPGSGLELFLGAWPFAAFVGFAVAAFRMCFWFIIITQKSI